MLYTLMNLMDRVLHFDTARAHCDIPCGIYDPSAAQIAALSVIRMVVLMDDLEKKNGGKDMNYFNSMTRYIHVKEEHAEKCKHEVRILMGDYFTPAHHEKFPELSRLGLRIHKLASESRQTTDRNKGMELLKEVNRLAEIFWDTKNIKTRKTRAPYKPEEEVVYPILP